jgi:FkbH-like protein
MGGTLYTELAWLPRAPADFAEQCRSVAGGAADDHGQSLRMLAQYALDANQLNRLANVAAKLRETGCSLNPLAPFRLGIISNATTQFLAPALVASAARYGVALECVETEFDQVAQEALSPESSINRAKPDAVLLAIDYRGLPLRFGLGDSNLERASVNGAIEHLFAIRKGIRANSHAISIVQTIVPPPEALFGSADRCVAGTLRRLIDAINRDVAESVAESGDLLLDVAALAEVVGTATWHDPTLWNIAKLPFSAAVLPLYADHVCRVIAALRGKSRRCLILDLDNTLWSGVIGDDGLEGIVLGQGDPTGEAHLSLQQTALRLRERGIVLAVSSKNEDATARLPFREHPEMLLREEHIAVFQANWNDKAANIRVIAEALSLGLDAMAFIDDNPAERALVRRLVPEVFVPELPEDPALYARTLLASGCFEAIGFSAEDSQRADFFQDNARRLALQNASGGLDDYLASLKMVMVLKPFDSTGRSRIVQLIAKSNQFNLTTRRYTDIEVRDLETDPTVFTLQVRLSDIFGDNGMISVVICRRDRSDWIVDTWLMSCRVLGRRVETAILQELVARGREIGIERIVGVYRPTERNRMVEGHYEKLGFACLSRREDGESLWEYFLAEAPTEPLPMEIERVGFAYAQPL